MKARLICNANLKTATSKKAQNYRKNIQFKDECSKSAGQVFFEWLQKRSKKTA